MKKIISMGMVVLVLIAFTACSSTNASQSETEESPVEQTEGTGAGSIGIPDTFGEIKDIVGNEVTLLIIQNADEQEQVPGSGMKRGNMGEDVVREYTGEETTLLIPVGTPMVKRVQQSSTGETGTGTGPVEEEVSLSELVKGSILKIYYDDEDPEIIEKIMVQTSGR
ncbi:hypothetical protein [Alkalibacter mobilis]|uniref:hypothetical protein n=1 Tax=Alkalibacter mobilis TaxID=2787712 RepID=UPI00189CC8CD|nr:hypothetical protein [Alkalibacter mobilis]MBF7095687.1 hypothetical protein [Alkalibacter mobilis]